MFLLMFALALDSMVAKSPTFDEQGFITRGVGYLRGENRHMRVGHPLGLNALNAAFLAFDDSVRLPTAHPSWQQSSFHRPSELFLWEIGNNVDHVIFLARLPTLWLGMLLAAVVARWAGQLTGNRWAGLLALGFLALDPNMLAHARLATTDLGLAAGATLAAYTLWRALKQPTWSRAILAGIAFGLLQNTKFTAALFVPLFALVILIALLTRRAARRASLLTRLLIAYPLAAFLTLWACYGFQIGTLPQNLPTLSQLSGLTLPLSHHLEQLLDIGGRLQVSTPSFLLGQYSDQGWWYYFPVAFLLKTPLPALLLLLWAAVHTVTRRRFSLLDYAALLIPALGYFAIALTTGINLGYRHILPVLPFLFVFIAVALNARPTSNDHSFNRRYLLNNLWLAIIPLLLMITLSIHPHYLAYFNLLAGGPDNGWRALVDSNLDWGQDLKGLKRWMAENDVDHVWLSYFGEARPEYYGISYTGLDSFPPRLMNVAAQPFYPHDPAPGIYAISATNLQGVQFTNHDQFAWFREKEPLAKVGYSIFIYGVAAYGRPVHLALGSVQLDELQVADYTRLETNDVTPHWFDASRSFLLPPAQNRWLALATGVTLPPGWRALLEAAFTPVVERPAYTLYKGKENAPAIELPATALAEFRQATGQIVLWQVEGMDRETAVVDDSLHFTTTWQQRAAPRAVKMFIHLTAPDGTLVAQWDGLGAAWEGWRQGDILIQSHALALPAELPEGTYELWTGLYDPADANTRWQSGNETRFYLGEVHVPGAPNLPEVIFVGE